jgi:long-subunit fatty acid transport protein
MRTPVFLRRFFALALAAAAVFVPSQPGATSVYSMLLIGETVESGDVRSISLGSSTQLVSDSLCVLQTNPALLSRLPYVSIGATQFVAMDQGRSDEHSERDISVTLSSVRVVFPIAGILRFGLGYTGRYEPDGGFSIRDATDGGDAYTHRYTKTGGIYSIPLIAAFDVTRFASVGLRVSFERGTVEERWDILFDDPEFAPGVGLRKEDLSGTGYGGGIVIRPRDGLSIGGAFDSAIDYDADVYERYTQTTIDTSYSASISLPARVSAGIAWRMAERFGIYASAMWSDFEKLEGLSFPDTSLSREQSYSIGLEYLRGIPLAGARLPVRVGFNYQRLPFEYPGAQAVTRYLVSLGTGVGIKGGKGKLEFALQLGKAGSLGANGLEDRLIRVYLGVAGGEIWRRKGGELY